MREEFGLHELAVEDAIAAHQRPKLEVYDGDLFVVLKTARYDDVAETVAVRRAPALRRRRATSSPCATARPARSPRCVAPSRTTSPGSGAARWPCSTR